MNKREKVIYGQVMPILASSAANLGFIGIIFLAIHVLNQFTTEDIYYRIRWTDILVGLTIYLKTSVDFAIFIGNLMHAYPNWKNRIAIEIGTSAGNALGTLVILVIWNFFRDIEWLLALMIFIAGLVLLKMAQEGLEHVREAESTSPAWIVTTAGKLENALAGFNAITAKFLKYIIPHTSMKQKAGLTFAGLLMASFTVPFILGLDDFAGYVPLFDIVNVFGFAIGVIAGHWILNIFLFLAPDKTIAIVKNSIISFLGSVAFVALALWGFYEVGKILLGHH